MNIRLLCPLVFTASAILCSCAQPVNDEAGSVSPPPVAESPSPDPFSESDAPAPIDPKMLALKFDPVCKEDLVENPPAYTYEHEGKLYGFESEACMDTFAADPEEYVTAARTAPATTNAV